MRPTSFLVVAATALWFIGYSAPSLTGTLAATSQRPKLEQSLDLAVPVAPAVVNVGGTPHLVHELHITNMRREPIALRRLRVRGDVGVVADLQGVELTRALARPGVAKDVPDPHVVGPGQRTVAFLWIALPTTASVPRTVSHRVELSIGQSDASQPLAIDGAPVTVSSTPTQALHPPLSGGPWVAIYDPLLIGGHRTAIYTLGGRARIPGRFAIDWIRAPRADASTNAKERFANNGFGADVLAVADARVASVMDDMPDLPPGVLSPPRPVSLENASGNYVALDLGDGRFAFYEHLRHQSIVVKVGDRVRRGQVIAQLGSSGSTSIGPHLHFHVADANAPLAAEGQPFVFRRSEQRGAYRSLDALLAGEPWTPTADSSRVRENEHPAPIAVVQF